MIKVRSAVISNSTDIAPNGIPVTPHIVIVVAVTLYDDHDSTLVR